MVSMFSKMIMAFAVVMVAMIIGCSEDGAKSQKQQQTQQQEQRLEQQQVEKTSAGLENERESKDSVLENNVKKNKVLLGGPEPRTHGCLQGCRGLPCDEAARCVQRNCSHVKINCEL